MKGMYSNVHRFMVSEDGPTAVEYAVMLAMIITACVTIVKNLGTTVSGSFSSASSALDGSGS
jgi:pilus assembly protein Flp/PilA